MWVIHFIALLYNKFKFMKIQYTHSMVSSSSISSYQGLITSSQWIVVWILDPKLLVFFNVGV